MSASDSNGVLQQPTEGASPRQNTGAPANPSTESSLEKNDIFLCTCQQLLRICFDTHNLIY